MITPALLELTARVLTESPPITDCIVLLQGDGVARARHASELYHGGKAPLVLVSGDRRDEMYACPDPALIVAELVRLGVPPAAIEHEAVSTNTREQAVEVLRIAHDRGWRSLSLIASPFHQLRAFLTFLRRHAEVGAAVQLWNSTARDLSWDEFVCGRSRAAWFVGELERIERYREHVATAEEGLHHLLSRVTAPSAAVP